VFRGAPAAAAASTIALAFEVDAAEPSAFVAVTRTRRRMPTSACRMTYVRPNACEIPVQLTPLTPPPLVSQRSQRYVNLKGAVPVQGALAAVTRRPSIAFPTIRGSPRA
jgi:hypothetical protein